MRLVTGVLVCLIWAFSGCATDPTKGYSSAPIFPATVKTVAVPVFTSESFTRDVEFELADALVKEIEARTPYKVVPASRADSVILGQIRAIDLDQLSKSRLTGLSEEVIVSVTIDFEWKDQRNGKPLLTRKAFTTNALFVPSRPSSEPIELGQFAVVQQMARDIVSEMQADW